MSGYSIDYIDVVVHVFTPAAREFYRLETLWGDVPQLVLPGGLSVSALKDLRVQATDDGRKLMTKAIAATVVAVLLSAAVFALAAPTARAAATNEQTLYQLINSVRVQHGLARLKLQPALEGAALAHSREMVRRQYFSHSSASGASFATRLLRDGYRRDGCASWAVSEVIGWGQGVRGTPQEVLRAWLASPVHRSIILGVRWA